MKKLTVLFFSMLFASALYADMLIPKIGIDMPGTFKAESGGNGVDVDAKMGYSLGVEYFKPLNDLFSIGGGFVYQLDREVDEKNTDLPFGYAPLYVSGMITPMKVVSGFLPYAKLDIGYNIIFNATGDLDLPTKTGGLYWGAGLGTKIAENYMVDVMYSSYAGKAERNSRSMDLTYTKIGINIGYVFSVFGK